ncbi:MAG: 5'-3' exonuclease, partial [Persephonella sp.]
NARFLVKLRDDVEIDISIDDLQIKNTNWEKLKEVFEELGFKSLLKNLKELRLEEGNKPLQKSLF